MAIASDASGTWAGTDWGQRKEMAGGAALQAFRVASTQGVTLGSPVEDLDQSWYLGSHQTEGDCESEIPEHLSDGNTGYARQPGEYVRPSIECVLGGWLRTSVSKVYFAREVLHGVADRRNMLCELVPEPGNWFDCEAVAVDIDQRRVGYLNSSHAHMWHEIVRRLNARSLRIMVPAVITGWTNSIDPIATIGIDLFLPFFGERRQLSRELGIAAECDALLSVMPENLRKMLIEGRVDEDCRTELRRFGHWMPSLPWNKTGAYSRNDGVPSVVAQHVDDFRFQLKSQWKCEGDARNAVENECEGDMQGRVLRECYARVVELSEAGAKRPKIAREVGVHPRNVIVLVDEANEFARSAAVGAIGTAVAQREVSRLEYLQHSEQAVVKNSWAR
ncbi:hypothetical protein [Rhodococcus sp. NPDC055024]